MVEIDTISLNELASQLYGKEVVCIVPIFFVLVRNNSFFGLIRALPSNLEN